MGLLQRTKDVISAKINKFVTDREDPMESLDHEYQKQIEQLNEVRKGITNLATAKIQLENHKLKLCEGIFNLQDQAKALLDQGKEDLARSVLNQKIGTESQIDSLGKQIKVLKANQVSLTEKEQQLTLEVQQFKAKKEVMKAQYSAAKAQKEISESMTGISSNNDGAGAIKRAEDKTNNMSARASAINELQDSGVLTNSLMDESSIDRDIRKLQNKQKVDAEMAALKRK